MTRDDVANLVLRTFALWLGATGLATLGSAPWMMPGPGGLGAIAMIAVAYLGVGAIVWLAATPLTRAVFARPDRDVPFALSMRGVPALASFVAGLFVLSTAVPNAVSWVAVQAMRRSMSASVLDSRMTAAFDERSVETGAQIVASVAVGVALLALSRRPNFWQVAEAEPDPEPSAEDA